MSTKISRRDALKLFGASAASLALAGSMPAAAEEKKKEAAVPPFMRNPYPVVFENEDVVIRQINEHLWVGNGHLYSGETIYIYEGTKKAVLIDTGTKMDHLDEIVRKFTTKPLTVLLTHQHPDHSGSVQWFPEVWSGPGDAAAEATFMPGYKGKVNHFKNHQIFDLGGTKLEVLFAPGHTEGSVLFLDEKNHFGFSGDAFGSGWLLMLTKHETFIKTAETTLKTLNKKGIYWLLPGHFSGTNQDTTKRIYDLSVAARKVLDGSLKGTPQEGNANMYVVYEGQRYNYKQD